MDSDNGRLEVSRLAMEIALAVSRLHPDYKHKGFDWRLHRKIIASLNEQGTPEPNSGIPLVLPRILELVRDGNMRVHYNENDAPPSDLAEVEAEPWDWYVTQADADVIRRAMGLGPLVDKWAERRKEDAERLERRHAAGIFTLDEVAVELAKHSPISIPRWRELLVIAVSAGDLSVRNPVNHDDPSKYPVKVAIHVFAEQASKHPSDQHPRYSAGDTWHPDTFLEFTSVSSLNVWLEKLDPQLTSYRFPNPARISATSKARPGDTSEAAWIAEAQRRASIYLERHWDDDLHPTLDDVCKHLEKEMRKENIFGAQGPLSATNIKRTAIQGKWWKANGMRGA